MNKIICLTVISLFMTVTLSAQDITLPKPQTKGGMPLREALNARRTVREFAPDKTLSSQQLSDLLWAACGVNRPDGRRTSPTAINAQEIDVYVFNKQGVYLYLAKENKLQLVKKGDYRASTTTQGPALECPLILVYVADPEKFGRLGEADRQFYCATDVGFVSQNVYLFCAQEGLNTVVMGYVEREKIQTLINRPSCKVQLIQPVGFPK